MDNKKIVDEMMFNSKYRELLITSPYFSKILQTIRYADTGEKELVEIISILCERIEELEKDLNDKIMRRKTESSGLFEEEHERLSGIFKNKQKSLSGLFPDGSFMND